MPRATVAKVQNLIKYSDDLSQALWSKSAGVSASYDAVAEVSTITVAGLGNSNITQLVPVAVVPGRQYTFSWLAKKVSGVNNGLYYIRDITNGVMIGGADYVANLNTSSFTKVSATVIVPPGCTALTLYPYYENVPNAGTLLIKNIQVTQANWSGPYVQTLSTIVNTGAIRNKNAQQQNLLAYSEQFDNAAWFKGANVVVTPNQTANPINGAIDADLVDVSAAVVNAGVYQVQTVTKPERAPNTKSIWLKGVVGNEIITIVDPNNSVGVLTCNLTTSWQRFSLTESAQLFGSGIWLRKSSGNQFYAWGAQSIIGNWPGPYVKTEATSVDTGNIRNKNAQQQNLLTYSEQFDNAAWTKLNGNTAPNTDVAPDGTTTAEKLNGTLANNVEFIQGLTGLVGELVTYSVYLKAGTQTKAMVGDGATFLGNFDLSNGTLASGSIGNVARTITSVGNGWYRCSVTAVCGANSINIYNGVNDSSSNGKYIVAWGAQVVIANWAGPYTKTEATTINTGNIRSLVTPVPLVNKLVDGNMEATNPAVTLVNGGFEGAAGPPPNGWSQLSILATREAGTHTGGSGSYVARLSYDGSHTQGFIYQTVLTVGKAYQVTGWARGNGLGDGSEPLVQVGGTTVWAGTNSATWQYFDAVVVAITGGISLYGNDMVAGSWVEFDDVTIKDVTPTAYSAGGGATLSKQTGTPHSGTQCLRVAGNQFACAVQVGIVVGNLYHLTGWARSGGGAAYPTIGGLSQVFYGSTSTGWQRIDITGIAVGTQFAFYQYGVGAGYVEFDDLTLTDLNATPTRSEINV